MLGIPGYRYDAATNRYFKLTAAERASAASQQHQPGQSRGPAPGPSSSSGGGRRGRGSGRRDAGASRHAHQAHAGPSRPQQHALSKRFPAARTSARELCDAVASTTVSTPRGAVAAAQLQHLGLTSAVSRLASTEHEEPSITLGDTVTRFAFDEQDPSVIRYGTTFGFLGHGRLSTAPAPFGHSVTSWRTDQVLSAEVTSLNCHSSRILATSFGPTCQAYYGNIAEDGHVRSSIVLSPRKTSIWTSSLRNTTIALGCDKKILISPDPARAEMRAYGTGSAVFALEQQNDHELLAGTRSGHVRLYDLRQARASEHESRPAIARRLATSVTHVRTLPGHQLLVALMDGSMETHDMRYLEPNHPPVLSLQGHVNSRTPRLGLDIYRDKILAAIGEDAKIRMWSLATGKEIAIPFSAPPSAAGSVQAGKPSMDLAAPLVAPSPDIRFQEEAQVGQGSNRNLHLWIADGSYVRRFDARYL